MDLNDVYITRADFSSHVTIASLVSGGDFIDMIKFLCFPDIVYL